MPCDRRQFLHRSTRAAMAGGALHAIGAACAEAAEPELLPIVDTHQHLWDLGKFRLRWLKADGPLHRSYLTKDYLAAVEGLNVVRAIYMEVGLDSTQHLAEAEHVVALCRRSDSPTCAAVIGGRPGEEGFRQYFERFKDSPFIKGIRRSLPKPEIALEKPFVADVRWLGELGMRFDLCGPPAGLLGAAKLAELCPDTRFILDHCGNIDPKAFRGEAPAGQADSWRRGIAKLARRPNVVCKISGVVARAEKGRWTADDLAPIVNHCLDEFGADRVVFGSDWPVCTRVASLREWVTALKEIIGERPQAEQHKLLHDNAVRFYGLRV